MEGTPTPSICHADVAEFAQDVQRALVDLAAVLGAPCRAAEQRHGMRAIACAVPSLSSESALWEQRAEDRKPVGSPGAQLADAHASLASTSSFADYASRRMRSRSEAG